MKKYFKYILVIFVLFFAMLNVNAVSSSGGGSASTATSSSGGGGSRSTENTNSSNSSVSHSGGGGSRSAVSSDTSTTGKTGSQGEILELSNICEDSANVVKTMRLVGYVLIIVKILIPIALLITGIITLVKAVIDGNAETLQKSAISLIWKFIAAIIIFVLPTIINYVVGLIDNASDGVSDYNNCRNCIFDPKSCKIPNSKF